MPGASSWMRLRRSANVVTRSPANASRLWLPLYVRPFCGCTTPPTATDAPCSKR